MNNSAARVPRTWPSSFLTLPLFALSPPQIFFFMFRQQILEGDCLSSRGATYFYPPHWRKLSRYLPRRPKKEPKDSTTLLPHLPYTLLPPLLLSNFNLQIPNHCPPFLTKALVFSFSSLLTEHTNPSHVSLSCSSATSHQVLPLPPLPLLSCIVRNPLPCLPYFGHSPMSIYV